MLQLFRLVVLMGDFEALIFSYQVAAAVKDKYLEECWFEIAVLIVVMELDFSFHEASLSMKPID